MTEIFSAVCITFVVRGIIKPQVIVGLARDVQCSVLSILPISFLWTIRSCCLYVFYEYYYHIPSYSLGCIFFINVCVVLFLFDNVIYVFLLLWLCILIVCLCMTTLTEVFPCFFLSCKANARVKPAETGHGPHSS